MKLKEMVDEGRAQFVRDTLANKSMPTFPITTGIVQLLAPRVWNDESNLSISVNILQNDFIEPEYGYTIGVVEIESSISLAKIQQKAIFVRRKIHFINSTHTLLTHTPEKEVKKLFKLLDIDKINLYNIEPNNKGFYHLRFDLNTPVLGNMLMKAAKDCFGIDATVQINGNEYIIGFY